MKILKVLVLIQLLFFVVPNQITKASNNYGSLMYEITSENTTDTSYLFGTMHIMPKDEFYVWDIVTEKLKSSDKLALEIDLDMDMDNGSKRDLLMLKMLCPDNKSMKDFITEDEIISFKEYIGKNLEVDDDFITNILYLKPFFAQSVILEKYIGEAVGFDMRFFEIAKAQKKEIIGLETLDFQIQLIDAISIPDQFEMFCKTDFLKEYEDLYGAYEKMDLYYMEKLFKEDKNYHKIEEEFVIKRNMAWINKIEILIKENKMFIAVGAGHLMGEHGLLFLLKERGFSVKPVPLTVNDI